jgi:uncharacterized protein YgfB (UPF0149 family)
LKKLSIYSDGGMGENGLRLNLVLDGGDKALDTSADSAQWVNAFILTISNAD